MLGVDSPPAWVSGVLAGVQGALLSLLAVTMPALAAYVATSADPSNSEVGWTSSLAVGAGLWLMGHGASLQAAGTVITLVPLGVTGLALFTAYASARRSAQPQVAAWVAGTAGYAGLVALVLLLAMPAGLLGSGGGGIARALVGGVVVGAVGLGAGTVRVRHLRSLTRPLWTRVDPLVRAGATAGAMVVAQLVGVAALVTGGWVVARRAAAGDVIAGLGVDTFGGLIMAVAQLAFAPTLVLWVVAWIVGPGFSVGEGTIYSPAEVVSGPLPALPMLGALPPTGSDGGPVRWVPLVVVLAGAVVGWWLRRAPVTRAWQVPLVCGWTALGAGLATAVAMALASGSAGPGRLAVVGASALVVGGHVMVLSLVGTMLTALPGSPVFRAGVRRRSRDGWDRLRGRSDVDLDAPATPGVEDGD